MIDASITIYSLLTVWLLGFFFLSIIRCRGLGGLVLSAIAVDFGMGAGLLYLILFLSSVTTGKLRPYIVYLLLAVMAVLYLYIRRGTSKTGFELPKWREIIGIILIIFLSLFLLMPAGYIGLGWDGWAIWAFKARVFFEDGKVNASFLADMERYAFAHLDYPLLIPLMEYWVYAHLGHINDRVIRLVPISFWVLMMLFFYSTLLERTKIFHAAIGTVLLSTVWPITIYLILGLVDGVQAFYNMVGLVYLFRWFEQRCKKDILVSALILGCGANVKNEGLSFLIIAISIPALSAIYKGYKSKSYERLYPFLKSFVIGIALYIPWAFEKETIGLGSELLSRGLPSIDIMIERLGKLFIYYMEETVNIGYPGWGLFWIFFAAAFLKMIYCSALREERYQMYLLICLAQFLIIVSIYTITPNIFDWHVQTSGDRTLLQLVPALFWIGMVAVFSREKLP